MAAKYNNKISSYFVFAGTGISSPYNDWDIMEEDNEDKYFNYMVTATTPTTQLIDATYFQTEGIAGDGLVLAYIGP